MLVTLISKMPAQNLFQRLFEKDLETPKKKRKNIDKNIRSIISEFAKAFYTQILYKCISLACPTQL